MGNTTLLIGLHWGDEGKGKVIDVLAAEAKLVIRFQGGANAGHTVHSGGEKYVLHLIPSGILHPNAVCIVGNGVVVDPESLLAEIEGLQARNVNVTDNLIVSDRAHVVLSVHKLLDKVREEARGAGRIGTTGRGIGPCHADKVARRGIRLAEFIDPPVFRQCLDVLLAEHNAVLEKVYGQTPLDADELFAQYAPIAEKLRPYVKDALPVIHAALGRDEKILLEGAQGSLLDINFGTYPFVTSSEVIGGAPAGAGIPAGRINHVLGVVKAYSTRVGAGPLPTEQENDTGERIRELGNEYGATTGRPRRCGWLDCVALRHSVQLSGVDTVALTLLDVLSAFDTLKICTGYRLDGEMLTGFPASIDQLGRVEPVYEDLPGWNSDITGARTWDDLPPNAQNYVEAVEQAGGARVGIVSVGPDREQTIQRD